MAQTPCRQSHRRAGDPAILIGSSEKIKLTLGWRPVYAGIKEIIWTAWQWQQKNSNTAD